MAGKPMKKKAEEAPTYFGFWFTVGIVGLIMLWAVRTHPLFIIILALVPVVMATLMLSRSEGERERTFYRDNVHAIGWGMFAVTFGFVLDGRTYAAVLGALLTAIAFFVAPSVDSRPKDKATTEAAATRPDETAAETPGTPAAEVVDTD